MSDEKQQEVLRDLTVFAWEFRYPGDSSTPSEAESYDAISLAEAVILAMRQRLAGKE